MAKTFKLRFNGGFKITGIGLRVETDSKFDIYGVDPTKAFNTLIAKDKSIKILGTSIELENNGPVRKYSSKLDLVGECSNCGKNGNPIRIKEVALIIAEQVELEESKVIEVLQCLEDILEEATS